MWGDATESPKIRCNGKALAVTEDFYDAMDDINSMYGTTSIGEGPPVLWIDAVYINQKILPKVRTKSG